MSLRSRLSLLRPATLSHHQVRCKKASLSRANRGIILACSSPHQTAANATSLSTGFICFQRLSSSSSSTATTKNPVRTKHKRSLQEEQTSFRRNANLLLDEQKYPPGSYKPEMWAQGRRILKYLAEKENSTHNDVNLSFSLLERFVKEHSVAGENKECEWLYSRPFLNRLVKQWRNVAKKQGKKVIDPIGLGRMLERLSKRVPGFKYDIATFSMILGVILHQQSTQEAPVIAESMLDFLREEADKGRPELQPNQVIYCQVLDAWAKSQLPEALERMEALLERMKTEGVEVNAVAWGNLMEYWSKSQRPERFNKMEELLKRIEGQGIENDTIVWNQLVFAHATTGQTDAPLKAEAVLDRMQQKGVRPDVYTYNHLMHSWSRSNSSDAPEAAEALFLKMKSAGIKPDTYTYVYLIQARASQGDVYGAEAILCQIESEGATPDIVVWNILFQTWSRSNLPEAPKKVETLFHRMKATGLQPDLYSYSHLMYTYALRGDAEKAESVLGDMIAGSIVPATLSWNLVLQAWSNSSLQCAPERAEAVFKRMKAAGVEPHGISYSNLIATHASRGNADRAERLLHEMIDSHSAANIRTHSDKSVVTYNNVLYAYCNSKDSNALQKTEEMIELALHFPA